MARGRVVLEKPAGLGPNWAVGLALAGFVAGAYAYTLHSMGRQESAEDRVRSPPPPPTLTPPIPLPPLAPSPTPHCSPGRVQLSPRLPCSCPPPLQHIPSKRLYEPYLGCFNYDDQLGNWYYGRFCYSESNGDIHLATYFEIKTYVQFLSIGYW